VRTWFSNKDLITASRNQRRWSFLKDISTDFR